jgi:hypothetical protein
MKDDGSIPFGFSQLNCWHANVFEHAICLTGGVTPFESSESQEIASQIHR